MGFPRLRVEILIVVRNYGFVDHVELIPPSQLLRFHVKIFEDIELPLLFPTVIEMSIYV